MSLSVEIGLKASSEGRLLGKSYYEDQLAKLFHVALVQLHQKQKQKMLTFVFAPLACF